MNTYSLLENNIVINPALKILDLSEYPLKDNQLLILNNDRKINIKDKYNPDDNTFTPYFRGQLGYISLPTTGIDTTEVVDFPEDIIYHTSSIDFKVSTNKSMTSISEEDIELINATLNNINVIDDKNTIINVDLISQITSSVTYEPVTLKIPSISNSDGSEIINLKPYTLMYKFPIPISLEEV